MTIWTLCLVIFSPETIQFLKVSLDRLDSYHGNTQLPSETSGPLSAAPIFRFCGVLADLCLARLARVQRHLPGAMVFSLAPSFFLFEASRCLQTASATVNDIFIDIYIYIYILYIYIITYVCCRIPLKIIGGGQPTFWQYGAVSYTYHNHPIYEILPTGTYWKVLCNWCLLTLHWNLWHD